MKVRVTRPDGTVIEAEGTAEECAPWFGVEPPTRLIDHSPVHIPFITPIVTEPLTWPDHQWAPSIVWCGVTS